MSDILVEMPQITIRPWTRRAFDKLGGFSTRSPKDKNDYPSRRRRYMADNEASTFFCNFYGLELSASVQQPISPYEIYYGESITTPDRYTFPYDSISYQDFGTYDSLKRFGGTTPSSVSYREDFTNTSSINITLYGTGNMRSIFDQVASVGNVGYRGHMTEVLKIEVNSTFSRYLGGTLRSIHYLSSYAHENTGVGYYTNWDPEKEEYVETNVWDGSKQAYEAKQNALRGFDPRLIREYTGFYNYKNVNLNDGQGNIVPLVHTTIELSVVSKQPVYDEDENGRSFVKDVIPIPHATAEIEIGNGKFFNYSGVAR